MERMIARIKGDGMFLKMWDESKWAIRPIDASIASSWSPNQYVQISQPIKGRSFNYEIKNVDSNNNVSVFALKMS